MFCPRCGAPINQELKFCRNCGLPISQVSSYVATGGTGNLSQPPVTQAALTETLTPRQRLILTIVLCVMSPGIVAVIAETFGFNGDLAAIPAVLMPVGIVWAYFHYKAVMRRRTWEEQQMLNQQATGYPVQPPQVSAAPSQVALPPHQTNPLTDLSRGSVVEDETRKLPEERR